jgi:hypothetical protein
MTREVRPGARRGPRPADIQASSRRWGPEAEGSGSRRAARLPVPVHQPFMSAPTRGKVQAALFYGWKAGLKTVSTICVQSRRACTALHDRPKAHVAQVAEKDRPFCAVCSA